MSNNRNNPEFDIFIANRIYPKAEQIFRLQIKPIYEMKDNCSIVLDTNALLVPYTIGKESLEQINKMYTDFVKQKRLIIPGQVSREFANNRPKKLSELFQQLSRKKNKISQFQEGRYPLLELLSEYHQVISFEKQLDELLKNYKNSINNVLEHIKSWYWNDPVSEIYNNLFSKDVIVDINVDENELSQNLQWRSIHKIPPGYKDFSKDDMGIGDLLIWHTILEVGKKRNSDILFVSGDGKPDWWHQSEGQALYPRYELINEYYNYTGGKSLHIIKLSNLLKLFGVNEKVVEEVRKEEKQKYINAKISRTNRNIYLEKEALNGVYNWIRKKYPDLSIDYSDGFPDFIITNSNGTKQGVEVKRITDSNRIINLLRSIKLRIQENHVNDSFSGFIIVLIFDSVDSWANTSSDVFSNIMKFDDKKTSISWGYIDENGEFQEMF